MASRHAAAQTCEAEKSLPVKHLHVMHCLWAYTDTPHFSICAAMNDSSSEKLIRRESNAMFYEKVHITV